MPIRAHVLASFLPLLAAGCWMDEFDEGDVAAEQAPEADELPSQPLPLEASPTAYGMLRVANELGFSALDGDVGLDRQAAASILAYRAGPDERNGTADDRYVEDIATLDSLYWLGEENLWRIQAFALLEGWVPKVVPEGCDGALAEVLAQCGAFVSESATDPTRAISADEALLRCVGAGDTESSAAGFFAQSGLLGYLDPALGYHAMLCGEADAEAEICELGVAGLAAHGLPECTS